MKMVSVLYVQLIVLNVFHLIIAPNANLKIYILLIVFKKDMVFIQFKRLKYKRYFNVLKNVYLVRVSLMIVYIVKNP